MTVAERAITAEGDHTVEEMIPCAVDWTAVEEGWTNDTYGDAIYLRRTVATLRKRVGDGSVGAVRGNGQRKGRRGFVPA